MLTPVMPEVAATMASAFGPCTAISAYSSETSVTLTSLSDRALSSSASRTASRLPALEMIRKSSSCRR
ncbi:hypothetical protein D3C73_1481890 [compost metagenome]